MGEVFDSISVCLSKGLGAPVGSVLLGTKAFVKRARRIRKVFGGGMRQAGIIAKGGTYALQYHVARLSEDHQRAKILGEALQKCNYVTGLLPVDTNIVVFEVDEAVGYQSIIQQLEQANILTAPFGPNQVRLVTHLDFDDVMLEETIRILNCIG
jgi:threonine aldolase